MALLRLPKKSLAPKGSKKVRKLSVFIAVMAIGFGFMLLHVQPAFADVNNFQITDFGADYVLSNRDKQGNLDITEKINVNFYDQNHGILRAIPDRYKGHSLQLAIQGVSSETKAPIIYSTYSQNGNTVIKIGDPSRTVTGQQEYTITYTLRNVISFQTDHDELYWDVNGNDWAQSAQHVSAVVHLPAGLAVKNGMTDCFTGSYGSTAHACQIFSTGRIITSQTTTALGPHQTLSFVIGFDKGYFVPSPLLATIGEYARQIIGFGVPFILLAWWGFWRWFKYGRDPKGKGTIVPEYGPPDNLSPLEVGTIIDFKTDNRDITATIVDLAVRRYIKIKEFREDKGLRKGVPSYTLELVNPDVSELNEYEHSLLNALFDLQLTPGREVTLSKLANSLAPTASTIRRRAYTNLTSSGYFGRTILFSMNSTKATMATFVVGSLLIIFVLLTLPSGLIGAGAGLLIAWVFMTFMKRRTLLGVATKEQILGLKLYLQTAEADRLKMLQSPKAPYAPVSVEPVKTVELFEKLLPYAVALSVEEGWAKRFASIYTTPPDWYSGNFTTFNSIYLASAISSGMSSSVTTAFAAPQSSSSSGFSGGFAGGGGGGGGGGGW